MTPDDLADLERYTPGAVLTTEAREDMQAAQRIAATVQQHFDLWGQLSRESPDVLAAIGCPPLPQAQSIGAQAQAMQQLSSMPGAPGGAAPSMPPPQQQKQPETDAPRGRPGPAPATGGQEPSQAMPTLPKPAKTPAGESVV